MTETFNLVKQQGASTLAFVLVLVGLILFLPALGAIGLFDPSDAYYSEGAREMLERGNLLVPYLNYANYYEKPILNYWLIIACYKAFGIAPFSARLPAVISAIGTSLLIFLKSRRYIGKQSAFLASLIFLTSPIVLIVGRFSLTDMPLCLLESGAILFLFESVFARQKSSLLISYVLLALAVLMKGPVAVVAVAGVFGSFGVLAAFKSARLASLSSYAKRGCSWVGLLLFCLIALPWYVAVHFATSGDFTQAFFIGQNVGRALGKVNHTAPFFYYIPIFLGSFFPWSILLLSTSNALDEKAFSRQTLFIKFCICWAVFLGTFFSITPTKLPTYILPLYPPCAIILACALIAAVKRQSRGGLKFGALFLSGISSLLAVLLPLFLTGAISMKTLLSPAHFSSDKLAQTFTASYFSVELWAIAVALTTTAYLVLIFLDMPKQALSLLVVSMVTVSACFMPLVIRHFYCVKQAGFAKLIRVVQEMNLPVATIEAFQPSACFALHRHVAVLKTPNELQEFLDTPDEDHLILVPDNRRSVLLWLAHPPRTLRSCGGWTLVSTK